MKKFINIITNNFYLCIFYIFTSFTFVTALKTVPYINVLPKIALIWALIISISNIYTILKRKPSIIEWFISLLLFISLVLNLAVYPNTENIKIWLVNLILLSAIFFINKEKTLTTLKKELFIISNFYTVISMLLSFISLILILLDVVILTTEGSKGFFENENALGISAAISFIITLYLIVSNISKKLNIFYIINLLIQTITIFISGGRSAFFIFITLIGLAIFLKLPNILLKTIFLLIPCMLLIYLSTFSENFLSTLTSGRNELWTSAIIVIKNNFLLGIGNNDLVRQVSEARYLYMPGIQLGGLHNIYIQTLTANGIFVFISFISFILLSILVILREFTGFKSKENIKTYLLLTLIISILLINLFESSLLYIISFISIIFWTYLGYTLSIINTKKRDKI